MFAMFTITGIQGPAWTVIGHVPEILQYHEDQEMLRI